MIPSFLEVSSDYKEETKIIEVKISNTIIRIKEGKDIFYRLLYVKLKKENVPAF